MKSGELKKVLEWLGDDFKVCLGLNITSCFDDAIKFLFAEKIRTDDDFGFKLWGSIVNVEWYRKDSDLTCDFSFRLAGAILADIHGNLSERYGNMEYMHYYCRSEEGVVDDFVEESLNQLGWYVRKYVNDDSPVRLLER